jgi:hypothetical protein
MAYRGCPVVRTLHTIDTLAAHGGVSKEWLYDQLRSGALNGAKLAGRWRIREEDWDAFVADRAKAS